MSGHAREQETRDPPATVKHGTVRVSSRLYAHPFAFSAALPPAYAAGILAAVGSAKGAVTLRERLASNALYFRKSLQDLGLDTGVSTTHVVPIILRGVGEWNGRGGYRDEAFAQGRDGGGRRRGQAHAAGGGQ